MSQAAPARFTLAQGLQGAHVIGHVGERAYQAAIGHGAGAHFQGPPLARAAHIGVGHRLAAPFHRVFGLHVGPRVGFYQLKALAKVATLGLKAHDVFVRGLGGHELAGQLQQFQVALVEHADLAVGVHLHDALRDAGQRGFQGVGFFTQQRAGAHQLGVHLAPVFFSPARHFQLAHGAEQRLQELDVRTGVAAVAVGQHDHRHQLLRGMDGQRHASPQRRQPGGQRLATGVGAGVFQDQWFFVGQHLSDQWGGAVKNPCLLKAAHGLHARGLIPADVRHGVQVQRGRATGRVLYVAHHAKAAAGQLHQLVEQGIESGFGLGTGNEHRLRPRDGL